MSQQCSEWSLVEKMLRCEARLWKDCCKSTSASEGEVLTGEGWGGALSPFPFPLFPFPFPLSQCSANYLRLSVRLLNSRSTGSYHRTLPLANRRADSQ
jgi:hypothetical protein